MLVLIINVADVLGKRCGSSGNFSHCLIDHHKILSIYIYIYIYIHTHMHVRTHVHVFVI